MHSNTHLDNTLRMNMGGLMLPDIKRGGNMESIVVTMSGITADGIIQNDTNILMLFIIAFQIVQMFLLVRIAQNGK